MLFLQSIYAFPVLSIPFFIRHKSWSSRRVGRNRRIVCKEFVSHAPLRETVHRALKHRAVERRTRGSLLKLCGLRRTGYRDELPKSVPHKNNDDEARRKEKSVPIRVC